MDDSRNFDDMTSEELTEVQRMEEVISNALGKEIRKLAQFMVTRRDDQLFGETEFTIRDMVLRMGAQALEATVDDRKKRGTKVAVSSAQTAAKTRVSKIGGRERS